MMTKSDTTMFEWRPARKGDKPNLHRTDRVEYLSQPSKIWEKCVGGPSWYHADTYRFPAEDLVGHNGGPELPSLPEDASTRNEFPMAEGLLDYFPNALAEVSRLSFAATQQHHPDQDMHWDRSKSKDHANKIMRHLVDRGKRDDKGQRHSTMVAWRALALLQEEIEAEGKVPPSRASRNA